jgi:hypothetical protein
VRRTDRRCSEVCIAVASLVTLVGCGDRVDWPEIPSSPDAPNYESTVEIPHELRLSSRLDEPWDEDPSTCILGSRLE